MIYTFILNRCDDLPTSVCCRTMGVSTSGFYTWRAVPISHRDFADAQLTNTIFDIHRLSRGSYGSPRVWAELRLGDQRLACSRKRVERLMRQAHIRGIYRHKGRGCTVRDPAGVPSHDLVNRQFVADAPDRLWLTDVAASHLAARPCCIPTTGPSSPRGRSAGGCAMRGCSARWARSGTATTTR